MVIGPRLQARRPAFKGRAHSVLHACWMAAQHVLALALPDGHCAHLIFASELVRHLKWSLKLAFCLPLLFTAITSLFDNILFFLDQRKWKDGMHALGCVFVLSHPFER